MTVLATAPNAYKAMLGFTSDGGEHPPASVWHAWHDATGRAIVDGIGATAMMHVFVSAAGSDIRPARSGARCRATKSPFWTTRTCPWRAGPGGWPCADPPVAAIAPTRIASASYVVDGLNVTGDTYRHDEDGYFRFVVRSDDMIVSSGCNIGAPEVESAVVGAPCPDRGMKVAAFVVAAPGDVPGGTLVKMLQDHVKAQIAPYRYPREIVFLDALPKTATSKIRRFALRHPEIRP